MKKIILIKYGEISLKKQNKNYFINALVRNINYSLRDFQDLVCKKIQGRLIVESYRIEDEDRIVDSLRSVMGIVSITKAFEIDKDIDVIKQYALQAMQTKQNVTFKVEAKRGDKSFSLTSPEICKTVSAHVLVNTETISVDVHNPDLVLMIEIRDKAYLYYDETKGECGLPVGVSGKGGLLLSGGIDSPVAGYLMAKRGMKLDAIHFHSYPFTSKEAQDKVVDLASKLSKYNQGIHLHSISLTKIQEEIISKCDDSYLTVILRRFMLKCAEEIAKRNKLQALITGESLGQVASQTIESITCTNAAINTPILRPLIGTDKNDIIRFAKHIDTYEISILPYEDCCTIFVPKHPQTKPQLYKVEKQETYLNTTDLIAQAMETLETINL